MTAYDSKIMVDDFHFRSSLANKHLSVPFTRTMIYQRFFFSDTIRLWNSVPASVASCNEAQSFYR